MLVFGSTWLCPACICDMEQILGLCGQVQDAFYSFVTPSPTGTEPRLVAASSEVAELIGLDPSEFQRPEFAMIFSGNAPLPGGEGYCPILT